MKKSYIKKIKDSISSNVISLSIDIWLSARLQIINNFLFISTVISAIIILVGNVDISYNNLSLFITYTLVVT